MDALRDINAGQLGAVVGGVTETTVSAVRPFDLAPAKRIP
jgi:hypothetical protein